MMVRIRLKQFTLRTVKKMHVHSAGPFKILNKLNGNTYIIDLTKKFVISYTFNDDSVDYNDLDFNPSNPWLISLPLSYFLRAPHYPHSQIFILIQHKELIKF